MLEQVPRFLFVGERPSKKAARIGATWHNGRLCAKNLREAVREAGLDPDAQAYTNLWLMPDPTPQDNLDVLSSLGYIRAALENGREVIGMGEIVCRVLEKARVPHRKLIHPAARGSIRKTERYRAHVRATLLGEEAASNA